MNEITEFIDVGIGRKIHKQLCSMKKIFVDKKQMDIKKNTIILVCVYVFITHFID